MNTWDLKMLIKLEMIFKGFENSLPEIKHFQICKESCSSIGKTDCRSRSYGFKFHPRQEGRGLPHGTELKNNE